MQLFMYKRIFQESKKFLKDELTESVHIYPLAQSDSVYFSFSYGLNVIRPYPSLDSIVRFRGLKHNHWHFYPSSTLCNTIS